MDRPGHRGVITAIGLVELTAALLILVPRTRALGALLAAGLTVLIARRRDLPIVGDRF